MSGFWKKEGEKRKTISGKISTNLVTILVPSLIVLILVACIMASNAVNKLNNQLIEAQTEDAVNRVNNFFESKMHAIALFQYNRSIQMLYAEAKTPEMLESSSLKQAVAGVLSRSAEAMSTDGVEAVWIAGVENSAYLMNTGEVVPFDFADNDWDERILSDKKTIVTEPFTDQVTGNTVISIVSPIFSEDETEVIGFAGFDVFRDSLGERLSDIKIGKSGFLDLLSNSNEYIYSADESVIGKRVEDTVSDAGYVEKASQDYEGSYSYTYNNIVYDSVFQKSEATQWIIVSNIPKSEVNFTRNQLILTLVILSVAILVLLIIVLMMRIKKLTAPIGILTENVREFSQGDLDVNITVKTNDEIGVLADSINFTIRSLQEIVRNISYIIGEIADGNLVLNVEGDYIGDFKPIKDALERIVSSLNSTLGQINISSEQVSSGSEQVSSGAQNLSQGATEQASSIEELAATINEISQHIEENAQNASQANSRASAVGEEARESNQRMQDMLKAMDEISSSSGEIGKIIKTIEDIAFQTNILALNAAVEAARAGEAGKGFAVVADEVRNLASKSAEASKNTSILIENSLKSVEDGTKIADETAESLASVVGGVTEVTETIQIISNASNEQAEAITQVKQGIDQISSVVQTNSATAEESAAASEELSSQAEMLKTLVGQFKTK